MPPLDLAALAAMPPHALLAAALAATFAIALLLRLFANALRGSAPPIAEGLPFIGGLLKFARGPWELMSEVYAAHGEVVTVPLLHKRMTFLFGPAASPHFFNAPDDKMSQTEVYGYSVPTFGPGVVYDVDLPVRTEQFKMVAEALRGARLKSYVAAFAAEAEEFFGKWGESGVVNLPDAFGELIILTASRTLLGREVRERMFERVAGLYHDLDDGMRPISVLFPHLPTAFHRRRDTARAAMAEIFAGVVAERRASGAKEDDMLQWFIDARYEKVNGGRALTDTEITGLLIAVLFAGQHTSTITASWTGLHLASNPAAMAAAVAEQAACLARPDGGALDADALRGMDVLHAAVTEALRLGPPLVMLLRYAKAPFAVTTSTGERYVIPAGHIVATSPTFSHRLPGVFPNPDAFEPERFAPPREEGKNLGFVGFGAGRHACMGQQFAYLQIKAIWAVLLRNFELERLDPFPEPDFTSMVIGPKPCRVRYTRRKLAPAAPAAQAK
jgi:sterol 14-demethylase